MKVLENILIICIVAVLLTAGFIAFREIDLAAKNTASYLEGQTAFSYENDSLVILNNEISLP